LTLATMLDWKVWQNIGSSVATYTGTISGSPPGPSSGSPASPALAWLPELLAAGIIQSPGDCSSAATSR